MIDGFLAETREKEVRCQTQVADVLQSYEDITAKVTAATKGLDDTAANDARKKTLTQLEQACEEASRKDKKTGPLKCESVNLYNGGQYWLYKYKRYDDVRLVFAPEDARRPVRRRSGQLPVPALVPRHVRCCARTTRTASRRSRRTSCRSTSTDRRRTTRCSCPAIPAPRIACSPSRS